MRKSMLLAVGAYAIVCVIWGTTWIAIKVAVTDLPPVLAAGLRFVVAAPILIVLCRVMRVPVRIPRRLLPFGAFVCLCYFCIPYLLLNTGERVISPGLTAICFSSVSVLIVLLSVPVLGASLRVRQVAGVLVAFGALAVLVAGSGDVSARGPWGVVAVLGAAFMHSFAYVWIKREGGELHVLTLNTVPMAVAGLLLTVAGVVTGHPAVAMVSGRAVLATMYLGVVASALCFLVYFWLLRRFSALAMAFIFVIFPVLAQVFEGRGFGSREFLLSLVVLGAFAWTLLGGVSAERQVPGERQSAAELPGSAGWIPGGGTGEGL